MTAGVNLGAYLAAGFVLLGLVATALIPSRTGRDDESSTSTTQPALV